MKKEHFLVIAVVLLLLSTGLDYIAGPIRLTVKDPVSFLTQPVVSQYPLTTFAVIMRVLGLFISVLLFLSFIEKRYFAKTFIIAFMVLIAEFYAIQQLSTGLRYTPLQWTISFAYTGALLIPTIFIYLLIAIYNSITNSFSETKKDYPEPILQDEEEKSEGE